MADAPSTSSGNFLTRKWHGVPGWAWVAVVGGGAGVVYYFYRQRQAAAATAASGTSTGGLSPSPAASTYSTSGYPAYGSPATTVVPSGLQTNQLLQILQDLQGKTSTSQTSASKTSTSSPGYLPPSTQYIPPAQQMPPSSSPTVIGAGVLNPSTSTSQYQHVYSPAALATMLRTGRTVYYEPASGVYDPLNASTWGAANLPAGTPIYAKG